MKNKIWQVGDMFCGSGGTSCGIEESKIANVKWAINHNESAIKNHKANHPNTIHYFEDIVTKDISNLPKIDVLWSSLECINFSLAKGGKPRNADSRMLANQMFRYALKTNPNYILIENVKEFMSWGPLDEKGKPISKDKGKDYLEWIEKMKELGWINYEWKLLNAADYGAATSRTRFFGIFSKPGYKISFPEPTHDKNGFFGRKKWVACKKHIDLKSEGKSIFGRKKPLVPATMRRIAYGIKKFCLNNAESNFLSKYYGNGENVSSVDEPCHTITTKDRHLLVSLEKTRFITQHIHGANNATDINKPLNTILTKDLKQMITIETGEVEVKSDKQQFFTTYFGSSLSSSIENPLGTITTVPKYSLTTVDLLDKYISDIKMRFLTAQELKVIQGFPENYILTGSQTSQKWGIGNSVPPIMAKVLISELYRINN